ncbi:hypothetical protein ABL78_5949 [Leptomonas seymouri]|uniref:Uncharacterized protein n=1 Tax=Leptomonas seymouri TaxID=5684 RepID=A0A0N1PC90_LEPSE|nr:hypothetical protein ABL78_5949 [Leptomonas seymouri]|eukprot:KPI84983.1 hypothetical protein ABL78_5949 [Leptomonas seymouri]
MRHQVPRASAGGDGSPSTPIMLTRSSGSYLIRRRADAHALHHHLNDASAAAALSPLLKSKYKSNAGGRRMSCVPGAGAIGTHLALNNDEKKKDDADREDKLVQLQQPDPGLEAADRTPTALRMKAQYHSSVPRRIPNSLLTGMEGVTIAATVDPLYTAPFLQLACREATEREVAALLRGYVKKISSKLHMVRVEGLKGAIAQLLQWATQASVESAERQHKQQSSGGCASTSPAPSAIPGALTLPPYDAVRVEVLGTSSSPAAGPPHRSSTLPSPRGGGGGGGAEELLLSRAANRARSSSWDVVQQALEGVDYTSAIFSTILIPRLEVRNAMSTGMPVSIQLSSEMALQWTTLPTTRNPVSMSTVAATEDASSPRKDTPLTPQRRNELLQAATAVTYEEQELALRYIQGACLTLYHQRRCCSEGCLIYYATEVFQCMRSHTEALFTWQRRELEGKETEHQQPQHSRRRTKDSADGAVADPTSTNVNTAAAASALRESTGWSPVTIKPALIRVVVALVEAVEAACHYNPSCLRRLVQTGCVTAMLDLAYCPFMPTPIRSAVLDSISVLLQEVNPLRRYVAAASKLHEGGSVDRNADPLLQRMMENAMHDNPIGHNGKQIPYSTERGSASKFDSAVRDWFFANGLGNVIPSVQQLQDLRTTFQSTSFMIPQGMATASVGGSGGGGGGAGSGQGGGVGPGSAVGGGPGGGTAAAAVAAATHANMLREGELYRKRMGRLLECMDGRELR